MGKTLTRWKASAIHLGVCTLIALAVFACMSLLWYPQPYFEGDERADDDIDADDGQGELRSALPLEDAGDDVSG